jgi:hypothetical protein
LTNFVRAFSALIKNPLMRFRMRAFLTLFYSIWYAALTLQSLLYRLFFRRPPAGLFEGMTKTILSPSLLPKSAPRVFIYSKSDKLVGWKDVEDFAGRCEWEGVKVVRERYERTGHVNHLKGEGEGGKERYWKTVKEAWDRSETQSK